MTWSISTSGTREEVTSKLSASSAGENQSDQTRDQHDSTRDLLLDEIAKLPEGAQVYVSASGHVDNGTSRTLSINVSGGPAPKSLDDDEATVIPSAARDRHDDA